MIKKIINFIEKKYIAKLNPLQRGIYMRKYMYHVGDGVQLWATNFGTEPYLISIDDNVNVAAGVRFINHDVSAINLSKYLNLPNNYIIDKVDRIVLHENSMIGAFTILMPGCSVGKNSIIAAGSIVTKHVPDNEVWGGVLLNI